MKNGRKKILKALGMLGLLAVIAFGVYAHKVASVGTSYASRIACSAIFGSGRDLKSVRAQDLQPVSYPGLRLHVDEARSAVTASLGTASTTSVYRRGLGAVQVYSKSLTELQKQSLDWSAAKLKVFNSAPGSKYSQVKAAVARAFEERDKQRLKRTRAVIVIYDGDIAAEQYAEGFDKDTRLLGWSMSKSVISALIGILVQRGTLKLHDPVGAPEWSEAGDRRNKITIDQCLRMSSGLDFGEIYGSPLADVITMLFRQPNCGAFAAAKAMKYKVDEKWYYSSGTTNILSRMIKDKLACSCADSWAFPRKELFDKLAMNSAIFEADESGHLIGSSFMYASARDWARFGFLYLQDGVWFNERILPKGWVDYSRKPTAKSNGRYGAHFWLNAGVGAEGEDRVYPKLPTDLYMARGFQGQSINIIPSRKVVIVRLGLTLKRKDWDHQQFLVDILEALPND